MKLSKIHIILIVILLMTIIVLLINSKEYTITCTKEEENIESFSRISQITILYSNNTVKTLNGTTTIAPTDDESRNYFSLFNEALLNDTFGLKYDIKGVNVTSSLKEDSYSINIEMNLKEISDEDLSSITGISSIGNKYNAKNYKINLENIGYNCEK